jgi:hypothetical protein
MSGTNVNAIASSSSSPAPPAPSEGGGGPSTKIHANGSVTRDMDVDDQFEATESVVGRRAKRVA